MSYRRRNHPCQILSRLVKGLGGYGYPKSEVSHWLWLSLLQQCCALTCCTVIHLQLPHNWYYISVRPHRRENGMKYASTAWYTAQRFPQQQNSWRTQYLYFTVFVRLAESGENNFVQKFTENFLDRNLFSSLYSERELNIVELLIYWQFDKMDIIPVSQTVFTNFNFIARWWYNWYSDFHWKPSCS